MAAASVDTAAVAEVELWVGFQSRPKNKSDSRIDMARIEHPKKEEDVSTSQSMYVARVSAIRRY